MSAIRLARGITGRTGVVKFAGCYHGHVDALLAQAGSGRRDARPADQPRRHRRAGRRHDRAALQRPRRRARRVRRARRRDRLRDHRGGGRATWARSRRSPGFNAGLRELCHAHGALLVIDEVMTGFRVSPSGWFGIDGVAGDLYTFGKVMSGGLPAAAFGGSAEHMAPPRPGRARLPGGHAVREPRRGRRRARHAAARPTTPSTRRWTRNAAPARRACSATR